MKLPRSESDHRRRGGLRLEMSQNITAALLLKSQGVTGDQDGRLECSLGADPVNWWLRLRATVMVDCCCCYQCRAPRMKECSMFHITCIYMC